MVDNDPLTAFLGRCQDYLAGTLHLPAHLQPCAPPKSLPTFLTRDYRYIDGTIARRPVLIMVGAADTVPPAALVKHREQVADETNSLTIIGADRLPNNLRTRLIDSAVPFIVPENQFYAPHLGMDLREQFLIPPKPRQSLMPAEQAILIHYLLGNIDATASAQQIIARSKYSPMSVSRAIETLTRLGLAGTETHGRTRPLVFEQGKAALFERAKPYLKSPVRGRHAVTFTRGWPALLEAGALALARKTDLSRPGQPVFAIAARDWRRFFVNHGIVDHHYAHEGEALIETWRYDPGLLAAYENVDEGAVDDLSLYASLIDETDERIQLALTDLIRNRPW